MEFLGILRLIGEFVYHLVAASAFSAFGGLFLLATSAAIREGDYQTGLCFAVLGVASSGIGWAPFWGESLQVIPLRPVVLAASILAWLSPTIWIISLWILDTVSRRTNGR